MRTLLKRPSPLAFPGGAPGIDPSHIAYGPFTGSAVAMAKDLTSLGTGMAGATATTSATAVIDGTIGPTLKIASGFAARSFEVMPVFNRITMASIFLANIGTTSGSTPINAGGSNGRLGVAQSTGLVSLFGTTTANTTIALTSGRYYFLAASWNTGTTNGAACVALDLQSGQLQTWTGNGPSTGATGSPWGMVNPGTGQFVQAACGMVSTTRLSLPQLLQWAADPWSFWYPPRIDLAQMLASAANGNVSPSIDGAGCSADAGSLALQDSFAITGAEAAASAGVLIPAPSAPLAGAGAVASAGTVIAQDNRALTGAAAGAAAGVLMPGVAVALSGAQAAAGAGSVSFAGATNAAIAGAAASALAGAVIAQDSRAMTGAAATAAAGALVPGVAVTLSGAQAAAVAGNVSFTGATNAAIAGAAAAAQAGALVPISAKALAGAAASGSAGLLFSTIAATLAGASAAAQAGSLSIAGAVFVYSPRQVAVDSEARLVQVASEIRVVHLQSEDRTLGA